MAQAGVNRAISTEPACRVNTSCAVIPVAKPRQWLAKRHLEAFACRLGKSPVTFCELSAQPQRLVDAQRRVGIVGRIDQLRFLQMDIGPV